jgi:hypothetical protein
MSEARFEAVFHGDDEFFTAKGSWDVVEWTTYYPNGAKSGRTVWHGVSSSEYDVHDRNKAEEMARTLQEEYVKNGCTNLI